MSQGHPVNPALSDEAKAAIGAALGRIPSGLFILTSQHEEYRQGMLCSWVQQVCFEPPMVCVAIAKGRSIMPLVSESRQFALCQLADQDRVLMRKFASDQSGNDDPFLGFELLPTTLPNLPVFKQAMSHLECELACHLDVEGDHDLFVGRVVGGHLGEGEPHVHLRKNGFNY